MESLKKVLNNSERSELFSNHELLLESKPLSVAIWQDQSLFYVFDSKSRDKQGRAVNIEQWLELSELDSKYKKNRESIAIEVTAEKSTTDEATADKSIADDSAAVKPTEDQATKEKDKKKVETVPDPIPEKEEAKAPLKNEDQEVDVEKVTNVIDLEPIPENEIASEQPSVKVMDETEMIKE